MGKKIKGRCREEKTVIESKLMLLAPRQANTWRDESLGQGIATLFGKPVDQEDGKLLFQRTIVPELEFRLFYTKGEGVKPNISWFQSASRGGRSHAWVGLVRMFPVS